MMDGMQPYLPHALGEGWVLMRDGDVQCQALYERHYSARVGRDSKLILGPGEKMVLLRADGGALFGWRRFKSDAGEVGVNCVVFRRESGSLASSLILEAEAPARERWVGQRFYTYVDPRKVRPTMIKGPRGLLYPVWGYCFLQAGWTFSGVTKSGKLIYEKVPA